MTKKIDGLPVHGYQPQNPKNVALVNAMKEHEESLLRVLDSLAADGADPRWLAIGRTQIEQGFMAVNRSIFKPSRVGLPGDGT
ncbi:cyclic nucleotide-binding protein [Pararhodobacter sp.]|uniref:Acb2/Tad1 domain-containing protein n=1 Tax=Pararhodobacter sp. TaxID=2127056 RepID=UPI002AFF8F73|nr:cyclic nucleotide-binding protein [Pararhodobacter sp.]